MYDNKYIKTRIKIYNKEINTSFPDNKIPENNECYTCLFVILLYNIVNLEEKYYSQILLEEFKYAIKNKKIINSINEELNLDESDDKSDNDKSNESEDALDCVLILRI